MSFQTRETFVYLRNIYYSENNIIDEIRELSDAP